MNVWFVDDHPENLEAWRASFPATVHASCDLRTFGSVPELFEALDAGERPDVMFVDYFMGPYTGMDVVERFLGDGAAPPLLIAHSSVPRVNRGMVRQGAHLWMEMVPGSGRTRSIVSAIHDVEDLERLVAKHIARS